VSNTDTAADAVEAMVRTFIESFGDPLIYAEADIVDDLVRIHRRAVSVPPES
jgi:hypothetical protein